MRGKEGSTIVTIAIAVLLVFTLLSPICHSASEGEESIETPAGWSDDLRLTNAENPSDDPDIDVIGENIYVVWKDYRSGTDEVYFKKSEDGGRTWSEDIKISAFSPSPFCEPMIAVNGSYIHVVWEGLDIRREVHYRNSTDGGETWNPEVCLSNIDNSPSMTPKIAVDGNNLHVLWTEEPNYCGLNYCYYINSTNGGLDWNPIQNLTGNGLDWGVDIAVNNSKIHISFSRWLVKPEVFYMNSTDGGITWNPEQQLTPDNGIGTNPHSIAVWQDNVHLVYVEQDEVYYLNSTDSGGSWNPARRISDLPDYSSMADIAVEENNVSVVWADTRDLYGTVGTPTEIYLANSTDGGTTWSGNIRLTNAENASNRPAIALENGKIHVVWIDNRETGTIAGLEIYYKRYPDFPPGPEPEATIDSILPNPHDGNVINDFVTVNATIDDSFDGDTILAAEYRVISPASKMFGPFPMTMTTGGGTPTESFTADWNFPPGAVEGTYTVEVHGQDDSEGWNPTWTSDTFDIIDTTAPLAGYTAVTPPDGAYRTIGTPVEIQATYEDFTPYSSATLYYWNVTEGYRANSLPMSNVSFAWNSYYNVFSAIINVYGNPTVPDTIFYEVDVEDSAAGGTLTATTQQRAITPFQESAQPGPDPYPIYGYIYQYDGTATGGYAPTLITGCTVEVTWWNATSNDWSTVDYSDVMELGLYSLDIINFSEGGVVFCNVTNNPAYDNLGYNYTYVEAMGAFPCGRLQNITCGVPYDVVIDQPGSGAELTPGLPFDIEYTILDRNYIPCPGYFTFGDGPINISAAPIIPGPYSYFAPPDVTFDGLASPDPGHFLGTMTIYSSGEQWNIKVSEGGISETNPYLTPWGLWWLNPAMTIPGWMKDWDNITANTTYEIIPLDEGWNLVSLPLEQYDTSIDRVLESIDGKWDCVQYYDATDSSWKSYNIYRPDSLNDLDTLNHKMGFWINITEPNVNLTVRGYLPSSTSINLYAGWNLVGYPTLNETQIMGVALFGTSADEVMVCDPAEPYRIKEVGPSYVMQPGEGYWVHVVADSVWIVDW